MTTEQIADALENLQVDTASTKTNCEDILGTLMNLESVASSINYIVDKDIPTIWPEGGADLQSISASLKANAEFLNSLIKFHREFATTLEDYATTLEKTGNKGN